MTGDCTRRKGQKTHVTCRLWLPGLRLVSHAWRRHLAPCAGWRSGPCRPPRPWPCRSCWLASRPSSDRVHAGFHGSLFGFVLFFLLFYLALFIWLFLSQFSMSINYGALANRTASFRRRANRSSESQEEEQKAGFRGRRKDNQS